MTRILKYWVVRSAMIGSAGGAGIVLLSIGLFYLGFDVSPAGFFLTIAVVLLSMSCGFVGSVVLHATKREGKGMEAHGGRLCAMPNKPRGATFQLTLPAVQGDAS